MVIQLTRLNNKPLFVNSDLIKFVEQSPDTLITLISGEKLVVRETSEEICSSIVAFRRAVLQGLAFGWDPSPTQTPIPRLAEGSGREPER
jgi:flagellar protein FlbD